MMRRLRRLALLVLVLTLWNWSPVLPLVPIPIGAAQPSIFTAGPAGSRLIAYTASQSVVNSTAAAYIFTMVVPAAYMATPSTTNVSPTLVQGSTAAVQTINSYTTMPAPLRVSLIGMMSYASGTINLAANYGGGGTGAATVQLVNSGSLTTAYTPPAVQGNQLTNSTAGAPWAPVRIDCWLIPVATGYGVLNSIGSAVLSCRTEIANNVATLGAANIFFVANSTTTGFNIASAQVLNIIWQWGTAAAGNALVIHSISVGLGW